MSLAAVCVPLTLSIMLVTATVGDRGSTMAKVLRYKSEDRWFDPRWRHGIFRWHKSFSSHYVPGVDSASNRNEYREYFLGVNAAGAWCWQTYHHPVLLSRNLGTLTSWNPLGHPRPVTGLLYLYLYEPMCIFLSTYSFISKLKIKKLHVFRYRNWDTSITNGHDAELVLCTGLPYNFFSQETLTFKSLLVTWCTNSWTFNNCTLCPPCIYVFCIYLRTNSDLCHLQYKLIGFYNRDEKCLQRGTDWVFK
jgi:hypothetical protein